MDVKETAARIVGHKTDIMTRRSLHPVLREGIEASALQIFDVRTLKEVRDLRAPQPHRVRKGEGAEIVGGDVAVFDQLVGIEMPDIEAEDRIEPYSH
jgi:rhodanese-related sulfurtransferase